MIPCPSYIVIDTRTGKRADWDGVMHEELRGPISLRPPYERRYCDFEKDHDHTCRGWRSRDEYKALRRGAVA